MDEHEEYIDHSESPAILARRLVILSWLPIPPSTDHTPTTTLSRQSSLNEMATMRAIVIEKFGGPESLVYREVPKPTAASGEALIHVKAFGVNHAEMHMRRGEWPAYNPITGLECVGVIEDCPGGEFKSGQKVAAMMGGMGLFRPGSYGEFVTCPISNIIALDTDMAWEDLAALPEVYATAYVALHRILEVQKGERLLIRGTTSTIGQAALNLAVNAGILVTATTRSESRFDWLRSMGAKEVFIESSDLPKTLQEKDIPKFDKILNLVGNSVLVQTLSLTRAGGRMLQAGWLGGLEPVKDFNPMVEMAVGVHFSLLHSKVLGSEDFPLSSYPLQEIVDKIQRGEWNAKPTKVFDYEDIREAHELLDSHRAAGKIVVKH
jgi:NADPH:quinone reductase